MTSQPSIFLVHGRDQQARHAINVLLEAIGVKVITWPGAVSELDINHRDIWRIVQKGFELAHAAVILFTPDEIGFLRPELWKPTDGPNARGPRYQTRQNVVLELGYALNGFADRTIHVIVGDVEPPTDRQGKWTASVPTMLASEFREHVAEMIQQIFSSTAVQGKVGLEQNSFKGFIEGISARKSQWLNAGNIEALCEREVRRKLPSFVEAGVSVQTSRFKYKDFFAVGREFILTGTNFGDQMGDPGTPPSVLHNLVITTLKRQLDTVVFLVLAPFELLGQLHHNAIRDLRFRSAKRLRMLQHDPRLSGDERGRLHIFDHPGAMFLSAAIRDPDSSSIDTGLVVLTPRWFKDEAGPQRMFIAVEPRTNLDLFKAVVAPIYPSIKVDRGSLTGVGGVQLGGRNIDEICAALEVEDDSFAARLADMPLSI